MHPGKPMPILASDAYPGKQICKQSAVMFCKARHPETMSPSTKSAKQSPAKKVKKPR